MKLHTIFVLCFLLSLFDSTDAKRAKRRRFDLEHAKQSLLAVIKEPAPSVPDTYNCDQAIDDLLLQIPSFGSLFYALLNGWYLGQWADYSSCLADATDSQYILATVHGNYTGPYDFTRGGIGKFTDGFVTNMGLCFPKQCTKKEVSYYTHDLIKGYAEGVGWTNVQITYHMASNYDAAQSSTIQQGTFGFVGILLAAGALCVLGTTVEMSTWGDKKEFKSGENSELLHEAAKFRRVQQYEAILLQRKEPKAQTLLCFSFLRNGIQHGILPRAQRTAIQREINDPSVAPDKRISQHLSVFNGIKGMATVLVAWGFTFYFVEYTVYSNTSELKDMQQTLTFNIVSGVVYTAPVFFFVSGFLQAFAFMQKDKNGSMFTLEAIFSYYFRKLMRYVPLNIVAMLALLYVLPLLGDGPVWNKFAVATQGCNTYWWTNIVWISNVYPRSYDDKCMPWTWFAPCYVQLSMLVPPLIAVYKAFENKCIPGFIYLFLGLSAIAGQFALVYYSNVGATMVNNDEFFAKVFMNPAFHFSSFLYGIVLCLVYLRFKKERGYQSALRNSFSSRLMEMIRHNQGPRYIMYLVAMSCCAASFLWQTPFVANPADQTQLMNAIYGAFAFPLFLLGFSMLVMSALASRAAAFRYFFASKAFTAVSHVSIGLYYTAPLVAIYYFMATQHQIYITYYMFVYYFSGNFMFGCVAYVPICLLIDRPILALINLQKDIKDARHSQYYNIKEYIQNFKETSRSYVVETQESDMSASEKSVHDDVPVQVEEERYGASILKKVNKDDLSESERRTRMTSGVARDTSDQQVRFTEEVNIE